MGWTVVEGMEDLMALMRDWRRPALFLAPRPGAAIYGWVVSDEVHGEVRDDQGGVQWQMGRRTMCKPLGQGDVV